MKFIRPSWYGPPTIVAHSWACGRFEPVFHMSWAHWRKIGENFDKKNYSSIVRSGRFSWIFLFFFFFEHGHDHHSSLCCDSTSQTKRLRDIKSSMISVCSSILFHFFYWASLWRHWLSLTHLFYPLLQLHLHSIFHLDVAFFVARNWISQRFLLVSLFIFVLLESWYNFTSTICKFVHFQQEMLKNAYIFVNYSPFRLQTNKLHLSDDLLLWKFIAHFVKRHFGAEDEMFLIDKSTFVNTDLFVLIRTFWNGFYCSVGAKEYVPIWTARPNSSVSSIPCLAKCRHVCV